MIELPDVLACARVLLLPELQGLAVDFGLPLLGTDGPAANIGLSCLEELRSAGSSRAAEWQQALLGACRISEILGSPAFRRLSFGTLDALLVSDAMHEDET